MPNLALDKALLFCKLPHCKKCGVQAVAETIGTDAMAYEAQLRIVCQECKKASEWHSFDNYGVSIPLMWHVISDAITEFNRKE